MEREYHELRNLLKMMNVDSYSIKRIKEKIVIVLRIFGDTYNFEVSINESEKDFVVIKIGKIETRLHTRGLLSRDVYEVLADYINNIRLSKIDEFLLYDKDVDELLDNLMITSNTMDMLINELDEDRHCYLRELYIKIMSWKKYLTYEQYLTFMSKSKKLEDEVFDCILREQYDL